MYILNSNLLNQKKEEEEDNPKPIIQTTLQYLEIRCT